MNKDELKKEAEKYVNNRPIFGEIGEGYSRSQVEQAYIDSAEPREKRIAELERKLKVETELSNRLGLAYREYEQLTKDQDEHLAELEKENAELKAKNKWYSEQVCNKECAEVWGQLTKAKDHIKKLLDCLKQDTNDPQTNYYVCQYMDKAEQFLNSEVEK